MILNKGRKTIVTARPPTFPTLLLALAIEFIRTGVGIGIEDLGPITASIAVGVPNVRTRHIVLVTKDFLTIADPVTV